MKLALFGALRIGEIDQSLAASSTNVAAQVRRWFDPGCHESLEIESSLEMYEHYSGCSGEEVLDFQRTKRRTAKLTTGFSQATLQNLRAFMLGKDMAAEASPVTVTNQTLNATSGANANIVGDYLQLGHMNIAALTITGNAIALVAGTDYELNPVTGDIRVLAPITGPVVATTYTHQNPRGTALFTEAQKNYVILLNGTNQDGGAQGQFCLYKVTLALSGGLAVTSSEISTMSCEGAVLADYSKTLGGALGQFGFIRGFGIPNA